MKKKKFCSLEKLERNNFIKSWVEEFKDEIIVFVNKKKIYVKSSICPHFGGPISYDNEKKLLFCYWHGLKFGLDGKCLNQKGFKTSLSNYEYEVKNNAVYIIKNENS